MRKGGGRETHIRKERWRRPRAAYILVGPVRTGARVIPPFLYISLSQAHRPTRPACLALPSQFPYLLSCRGQQSMKGQEERKEGSKQRCEIQDPRHWKTRRGGKPIYPPCFCDENHAFSRRCIYQHHPDPQEMNCGLTNFTIPIHITFLKWGPPGHLRIPGLALVCFGFTSYPSISKDRRQVLLSILPPRFTSPFARQHPSQRLLRTTGPGVRFRSRVLVNISGGGKSPDAQFLRRLNPSISQIVDPLTGKTMSYLRGPPKQEFQYGIRPDSILGGTNRLFLR